MPKAGEVHAPKARLQALAEARSWVALAESLHPQVLQSGAHPARRSFGRIDMSGGCQNSGTSWPRIASHRGGLGRCSRRFWYRICRRRKLPPRRAGATRTSSRPPSTKRWRGWGRPSTLTLEGKRVEGIDVVPLEVIEPRDPAPRLLNLLHATTRPFVIEREVLLREGEPYSRVLCDETARNLRQLPQLSLVICTAIRGAHDDTVRVLVITKDVWSLRLGWDVAFIGGDSTRSSSFRPKPTSPGRHQTVLARYIYQPLSQSFALGYRVPRLGGTRVGLSAEAGLSWNRNGNVEGSSGSLSHLQAAILGSRRLGVERGHRLE